MTRIKTCLLFWQTLTMLMSNYLTFSGSYTLTKWWGNKNTIKAQKIEGSSSTLCQSIFKQTANKSAAFFIVTEVLLCYPEVCLYDWQIHTLSILEKMKTLEFSKKMYFYDSYENTRFFSHLQIKQCLQIWKMPSYGFSPISTSFPTHEPNFHHKLKYH